MTRAMTAMLMVAATGSTTLAQTVDLELSAEPYLTGGLFTKPLLPQEGEEVVITVRAICKGEVPTPVAGRLVVTSPSGESIAKTEIALERTGEHVQATWPWLAPKNGPYHVRVELDPSNDIRESDEQNNAAELLLPVLVKGRRLHFPWYREPEGLRWVTCVTSTKAKQRGRLLERGVLPLDWEYGGMSWSHYDKGKAKTNPDAVLEDIKQLFRKKYARDADVCGFGIDECGGYPGTFKEAASIASMKALVYAKRQKPDRFFAVWNGGGLNPKLATYYRMGADLLLLETYLWRALPEALGTEEIYQTIRDRLDPVIRSRDMLTPAYGNHCYTLIALDSSERPDWIPLGEMENVVRYIRRICPEMRGLGWYNGGYGSYGLRRTSKTDKIHEAVLQTADRLCFKYFIKPCITLMPGSLWIERTEPGRYALTVAVSNIGGMDCGPVMVQFLIDGKDAGRRSIGKVPAGVGRTSNRVFVRQVVSVKPGLHRFEARIVEADDATVLDPIVCCSRFLGCFQERLNSASEETSIWVAHGFSRGGPSLARRERESPAEFVSPTSEEVGHPSFAKCPSILAGSLGQRKTQKENAR